MTCHRILAGTGTPPRRLPRRPGLVLLLAGLLKAQTPSGTDLLDSLLIQLNPVNARGIVRQTITTTSGQTRTFEYEMFSGNRGEKTLMRYREPARVRGNALLMTGYSNQIWMFNRRTNRVRKLASHAKRQKFEGSDFTYEDLGSGQVWKQDYTPENKGRERLSGQECIRLELTARHPGAAYSRITCWLRQPDLYPIRIDYFDEHQLLFKSLILEDIRVIEDLPTARHLTMQNHRDRSQTSLEYVVVTYQVSFDSDFFSVRKLTQ